MSSRGNHILLVAAVSENGVIGRGNALPWRLKSDMQHFRAVTMGKPVIMGRKTYLLDRQAACRPHHYRGEPRPGFCRAGNSRGAEPRCRARRRAWRRAAPRQADAIIVAGGGDIYAQAMPLAARLVITYIHRRGRRRCLFSDDRSEDVARNRPRRTCSGGRRRCRFRVRHLRTRVARLGPPRLISRAKLTGRAFAAELRVVRAERSPITPRNQAGVAPARGEI